MVGQRDDRKSGEFMKKLLFCFGILCLASAVFAQNADKVSKILEQNEISKGEASYFVCVYKNFSEENVSDEEAFSLLAEKNLFKVGESSGEDIPLSEACLLILRTSEAKGGIFYSIFKSSRYALREFKAMGIVPKNADPNQKVSGNEFIAMINGFEKWQKY